MRDSALPFPANIRIGAAPQVLRPGRLSVFPGQISEIYDSFSRHSNLYLSSPLHSDFPDPLNVIIIVKTNLNMDAWAYVILCSSDLALSHDNLIAYNSLRFQLEFTFHDAKQYWGLEDFINVNQTAVTNAAHLSLFMVNVSHLLRRDFRQSYPEFSVLNLKANFRGDKYASDMIKMLPQKPDAILRSFRILVVIYVLFANF
jgi:putative transposase